jgi:DNA-binding transcriptional MerR regulator
MLTETHQIEKIYFTIGEVADMFDVNTSLIRFWEKEFPQLQPRKNARGNRVYTKKDVELFRKIHHLVKERGYTLDGAKLAFKQTTPSHQKSIAVERLLRIKQELLAIRSSL